VAHHPPSAYDLDPVALAFDQQVNRRARVEGDVLPVVRPPPNDFLSAPFALRHLPLLFHQMRHLSKSKAAGAEPVRIAIRFISQSAHAAERLQNACPTSDERDTVFIRMNAPLSALIVASLDVCGL
jgi:hypothetical protein